MISNDPEDDWQDALFFSENVAEPAENTAHSLAPVAFEEVAADAPRKADVAWAARRERFTRLVTRTVVGLGVFALCAPLAARARARTEGPPPRTVVATISAAKPAEPLEAPINAGPSAPVVAASLQSAALIVVAEAPRASKARATATKPAALKVAPLRASSVPAPTAKPAVRAQPAVGRFPDPS